MSPYRHTVSRIVFLTLVSALVAAQDEQKPFDCHITSGEDQYDLTSLAGEHAASREVQQPPSVLEEKVTFNLCEDLKRVSSVPDDDQCPSGTRACLIRTDKKNAHSPRVVSVVPLANSSASAVTYDQLSSPKGLDLTFGGAWYPVDAKPAPQYFHLKLLCDTNAEELKVDFVSYNGTDLWLETKTPAGCPLRGPPQDDDTKKPEDGGGDKGPGGEKEEEVGSGLGYFFLLFFLAFAAYFGLGAYYNYSTYGATGTDLIPHRDFWREVPYMLRDLVSHICSAVRPRQATSRGGYIAV
ncbi:autophagy-related protein 27 [Fomes fomentarius]|nr:autophagy-related protein 27 [Fomes fomentarius]